MARIERQKRPWDTYILLIIVVVLAIVGLTVTMGGSMLGSVGKAVDDIKPQSKRKMEKPEVFVAMEKAILRAKPRGTTWTDLDDAARDAMVKKSFADLRSQGFEKDVSERDVRSLVNEIWREKRTEEQTLPSDDAGERWKQLTGKKFDTIRRIDLLDETGTLNCPQVDIFEDAKRATNAGQMNHDEWVVILEEQGDMTKVKRRRDQKEGWIESKYLKEVYTKDDIQQGPSKKVQERDD